MTTHEFVEVCRRCRESRVGYRIGAIKITIDTIADLRSNQKLRPASLKRKSVRQSERKRCDPVRFLPHQTALADRKDYFPEAEVAMQNVREACKSFGLLSEALVPLLKIWRSASNEEKHAIWVGVGPSVERRLRRDNKQKSRRDGKWCAVVHRARGELLCEPAGRTVMGSYDSADEAARAAKLMVDQVLLELSTRCG